MSYCIGSELVKAELQRRKDEKNTAVSGSRYTGKYQVSGLLICGECECNLPKRGKMQISSCKK